MEPAPPRPSWPGWALGVLYGLALLAGGWILGPLRVMVVAPLIGPLAAVGVEGPILTTVMILTVRWMERLGLIGREPVRRATIGLTGAGVVLVGEVAGALLAADHREALSRFFTPVGLFGLALVGVAAVIPLVLLAGPSPARRLR
ncbi:MAG: hypothetical protein V4656_03340 [Pseudomonadota bacterium]